MRQILAYVLMCFGAVPATAQLVVQLKPETSAAFESYAAKTEASLRERWSGRRNFLALEDKKDDEEQCLGGKLIVRQMISGPQAEIPDGLIHDWMGAVYIRDTTMAQVLEVLENFDEHKNIYPEVVESKTISRKDHRISGSWRLQQKGLVPVILDVEQSVDYEPISASKWTGHSYARKVVETDTAPFSGGRKFPVDEGHGYLWRLYSYWALEEHSGGVLAECRTLSLSRDIPAGLGWAVGPYVRKTPQNSLRSTLEHTRQAASHASEKQ